MINLISQSRKAFTLIEVLVSMVVVMAMASAGWYAVSTMSRTNQYTRDRITAVNLLRKSQEEVRKVAQTSFPNLNGCTFNTCGFDTNLPKIFDGFTRALSVENDGSPDIKRVVITVSWTDATGADKTLQSVLRMAKPASTLPGNIIGEVTNSSGNLVDDVEITVVKSDTGEGFTVRSQGSYLTRADEKQVNYDFINPVSNQFQLTAGAWNLTAEHEDYRDYGPVTVDVPSNSEKVYNFQLEDKPDSATINVYVTKDGQPFTLINGSEIELFQDSDEIADSDDDDLSFWSYEVKFDEDEQKCFTVRTDDTYESGAVGDFNCDGAPRQYDHDGWSSAIVQEDGSINCSAPFSGNSTYDRICVNPGDEKNVVTSLVDVPTATITGKVTDIDTGEPLAGVNVRLRWHNGGNYPWPNKISDVVTDDSGNYLVTAPALQAFYPANNNYRVELSATKTGVPQVFCCNTQTTITVSAYANPRYFDVLPDITYVKNIAMDLTPNEYNCGNATGNVINDLTGSAIGSAVLEISGENEVTNGGGNYVYQCEEPVYYRLRTGNYTLKAWHADYYHLDSSGNDFYVRWNNPVVINADATTNVQQARLWPVGERGSLTVIVEDASAENLRLPDIEVELRGYDLRNYNTSFRSISPDKDTDNNGQAIFENLLESWPPENMPDAVKPRYNLNERDYSIEIDETEAYQAATVTGIKLEGGTDQTVTVQLVPKGAM